MDAGLGTELPQRTSVVWLLLACGLVLVIPTLRMVGKALAEDAMPALLVGWGMTLVVFLLFVVLPLYCAWNLHQRHYVVSDTTVTRLKGDTPTQTMAFADVEEVRARFEGGLGAATPEWFNQAVVMIGTDKSGERRQLRVSKVFVESLHPLLERLAEEVDRRPQLLTSDAERELFTSALSDARKG